MALHIETRFFPTPPLWGSQNHAVILVGGLKSSPPQSRCAALTLPQGEGRR